MPTDEIAPPGHEIPYEAPSNRTECGEDCVPRATFEETVKALVRRIAALEAEVDAFRDQRNAASGAFRLAIVELLKDDDIQKAIADGMWWVFRSVALSMVILTLGLTSYQLIYTDDGIHIGNGEAELNEKAAEDKAGSPGGAPARFDMQPE